MPLPPKPRTTPGYIPATNTDVGPSQQHFKSNYIEVLKRITPEFYLDEEYKLFGEEEDLQYRVLGSILSTANNLSSLIPAPIRSQASSLSSNLELVPYFVPFNDLTNVSPSDFEKHVLRPLGRNFKSFKNQVEFSSFVTASALPSFALNQVPASFVNNYSALVDPTASSTLLVQDKLLDALGWVYLLNTSGQISDANAINPSSVLASSLSEDLFFGNNITTEIGVSRLFQWLALNVQGNGTAWQEVKSNYVPAPFNVPSSTLNDNYWASGGALVSSLDTMVKVWVNEDDPNSIYFRDIVNASLLGLDVRRMENKGPMGKMLKALAYAFYDVRTSIRDIQFLLDIEECPQEFLEYLATYLGWTFFTENPDNWRDQLKQAIYIYKAKGTRQALANATNMVIPSSVYNPNDAVTGLQELYESYFPNLLYYVVKTETDLGYNLESYKELASDWRTRFEASGYDIQVKPFDPINPDNNARYVVDFILQYLNIKFDYLKIGTESYKDTEFIDAQVSAAGRPGYFYRGYNMRIPPWEESRFYQNCDLNIKIIRDTSSLLSRERENFGLGIATSSCETFAEYVASSIEIKNANPFDEPGMGDNIGFKFMTSSYNLPYNYKEIVETGNVEGMSVIDYWNSKASEVHSKFHLSGIDFEMDDFLDVTKTKIGRKGIPAVIDIFRQFAPFHVLNKIYAGSAIVDNYGGRRNNADQSSDTSAWSGTTDIQIINTLQTDSDQFNSSYIYDAFPGTQGLESGYFSSVGLLPSKYNPNQGRWLPSATLNSDGYFWSGGNTFSGGNSTSSLKELTNAPRVSSRRKSLKYKFTGWAQNREGLNQPIPTNFFTSSYQLNEPQWGLVTSGFIPKGFNFSSQSYEDTSGTLSSVYSEYNTSSTPFFQFIDADFFPARAVADKEVSPSSWVPMRDVFGAPILRALTDIFLRRGEVDSRWLNFTNTGYKNFKFGHNVIQLYQEYNNTFKRQLINKVQPGTLQEPTKYGGGFNLLAHAFGPGLFNHDISIKGPIIDQLSAVPINGESSFSISDTNKDWSSVVATNAVLSDKHLFTSDGRGQDLSRGILQPGGFNTYQNPFDIFENPTQIIQSNNTLLSGIEMVSPNVNSIAVWNHPGNDYNVDNIADNGLTLIKRNNETSPNQGIRVRYVLDGNKNFSYNGKFIYPPFDSARQNASTSSIAGWRLLDRTVAPDVMNYNGGLAVAAARVARFEQTLGSSALPYVALSAKGRGNIGGAGTQPLSNQNNPALTTVIEPTSNQTPKNLRNLTPNTRYELCLEASSVPAATGTPYIVFGLFNITKQKQWTGTTWTAMSTTMRENTVVTLASGTDPTTSAHQATLDWREYKADFTTDYSFESGDSYQLYILPINASNTQTHTIGVRDVSIKYKSPTQSTKVFNGVEGNKLFKDQEYKMKVRARVANINKGLLNVPETLYARIAVEQKPFVGNGWEKLAKSFSYHWAHRRWVDTSEFPAQDVWVPLHVTSTSESGQEFDLDFNTFNWRTPLGYQASIDYFASAGPVHDDNSVYYIEITKAERTGLNNGVTLLETSLYNKNYNMYVQDYTREDFVDVFEFFDDLNISKSSRDAHDSSSTYLLSGGSRSEYLEYWGGGHSSTFGTYTFVDNEG